MTHLDPQLDLLAGQAERDRGFALLESYSAAFLDAVRARGRYISMLRGSVTIDDLREWAAQIGIAPTHRNSWGNIFRGPGWKCIGHEPSKLVSNHARMVSVWRWEP